VVMIMRWRAAHDGLGFARVWDHFFCFALWGDDDDDQGLGLLAGLRSGFVLVGNLRSRDIRQSRLLGNCMLAMMYIALAGV
jgi:hypothetical protein